MKKALTFLVLTLMADMTFAQGTVSFGNQTGLVKQWTSFYDSTLVSVPRSGGYVQLFAAPAGTLLEHPLLTGNLTTGRYDYMINFNTLAGFLAANPQWELPVKTSGALPVLIGAANGIFNGGTFTINNIGPGADASYFAIGWTGNYPSFDSAIAGLMTQPDSVFIGMSAIFTTRTGNPLTTPPGTAVFTRTTFEGITLGVLIPEPSTFALAGFGAAVLMIARRRR